jgi:hypothetical protein
MTITGLVRDPPAPSDRCSAGVEQCDFEGIAATNAVCAMGIDTLIIHPDERTWSKSLVRWIKRVSQVSARAYGTHLTTRSFCRKRLYPDHSSISR